MRPEELAEVTALFNERSSRSSNRLISCQQKPVSALKTVLRLLVVAKQKH